MSFEALVDAALSDPLAHVGNHRTIGYVGADVPIELILAANAQPVRLRGCANLPPARADRFVEESFSITTRRIAEQWLAGELDALEAVIFSRSDDSAQRLYYYVCELQRTGRCGGPRPLLFDLASLQRASSAAHTLESTRALAAALGATREHLPDAIAQVRRRLGLLERFHAHRAKGNVRGRLAHRVLRALECRWTAEFDEAFEHWLDTLVPTASRPRLVLVGSEPSDERLHEAVEAAGATFIEEIHEASFTDERRVAADDPLAAIAARYHRRANEARATLRNGDLLTRHVRALQVDGAVLWLLATDTGLAWEVPRMEQALREAGCAVLKLVLQSADPDAASLSQLAEFVRTLEVQ